MIELDYRHCTERIHRLILFGLMNRSYALSIFFDLRERGITEKKLGYKVNMGKSSEKNKNEAWYRTHESAYEAQYQLGLDSTICPYELSVLMLWRKGLT